MVPELTKIFQGMKNLYNSQFIINLGLLNDCLVACLCSKPGFRIIEVVYKKIRFIWGILGEIHAKPDFHKLSLSIHGDDF